MAMYQELRKVSMKVLYRYGNWNRQEDFASIWENNSHIGNSVSMSRRLTTEDKEDIFHSVLENWIRKDYFNQVEEGLLLAYFGQAIKYKARKVLQYPACYPLEGLSEEVTAYNDSNLIDILDTIECNRVLDGLEKDILKMLELGYKKKEILNRLEIPNYSKLDKLLKGIKDKLYNAG